jgi:hypothetical protein
MKLKINIKPQTTEKRHKPVPNDLFWSKHLSFGSTSNGVSWGYYDAEFAYAFVWHKVRPKMKSSKKIKKVWNDKEVTTTKRTYEPGKWIVQYYKIPREVLKFMNLELQQGVRSFKLVPKK